MSQDSAAKKLQESLTKDYDIAWSSLNENETEETLKYNEGYKTYLTVSKTERLCAHYTVQKAEAHGFKPLDTYIKAGEMNPGDKAYVLYKNKSVLLFTVGKQSIEKGMAIVGAHIDAPRLDLKPVPLYEESNMGYFKTHYYGGIKKYQWVTIPLALHGTVVKKDGQSVSVSIGEKAEDPVFCITDLLPHLSQEQNQKKMPEGITGEGLNILVGSIPYADDEIKEPVKLNILNYLKTTYDITEDDFASAELEAVPAGTARDVGFDRGIVGSYGQDDRVCAYAASEAHFAIEGVPERTLCTILADKEEIGSYGSTGMQSKFFEYELAELIHLLPVEQEEMALRRCLRNSSFLSADVTAGVDPNFAGTHDKYNAPYIGKGVVISKYGGSRGKSGSNDAHAEFLGALRQCFDEANVVWQMGELGRVDLGGGGTIAYMLAEYGMDVVDCGPALLSMHAPFELCSKVDAYMTYKAYKAFFQKI